MYALGIFIIGFAENVAADPTGTWKLSRRRGTRLILAVLWAAALLGHMSSAAFARPLTLWRSSQPAITKQLNFLANDVAPALFQKARPPRGLGLPAGLRPENGSAFENGMIWGPSSQRFPTVTRF
jgi:hypothetical protein